MGRQLAVLLFAPPSANAPINLPFFKPLDLAAFNAARQQAHSIYEKRGAITIADIDAIAADHAEGVIHRIAVASRLHDFIVSYGLKGAAAPVKSQVHIRHAALIHDVFTSTLTRRELSEKHDRHEKSIPRIMRQAGHSWNARRRRWEPQDADRHYKSAQAKLKAHRAWITENKARCGWRALPERPVDIRAICGLQIGVCLLHGKMNLSSHGSIEGTETGGFGEGYGSGGNYLMRSPSALARLVSQEVKLAVVGKYPALVWPDGSCVYLHERNWLIAHGVMARPGGTEIHHIDGNPLNAAARNLCLLTRQEHQALHSRKRKG